MHRAQERSHNRDSGRDRRNGRTDLALQTRALIGMAGQKEIEPDGSGSEAAESLCDRLGIVDDDLFDVHLVQKFICVSFE